MNRKPEIVKSNFLVLQRNRENVLRRVDATGRATDPAAFDFRLTCAHWQ